MNERKRKADHLRYMRKIRTPHLTMRERNRAIRSHAKVYIRNTRDLQ